MKKTRVSANVFSRDDIQDTLDSIEQVNKDASKAKPVKPKADGYDDGFSAALRAIASIFGRRRG